MVDLSHWDFQDEFELFEVAALIAGMEPANNKKKVGEIGGVPMPIAKRVMDAVHAAYMCQKQQKPIPGDCMQSNMFDVFDNGKNKGMLATIGDMVLGGGDIVVHRNEVARWLDAIGLQSKYAFRRTNNIEVTDKALSTRERNTLLTLIAVLCAEAKLDYSTPAKTANLLLSTATKMGVSIGETTIEGYLKKVPDALGTRMK